MDQVVWASNHRDARGARKLAAIVPGLVRRLLAGMQSVATDAEARERFLGELMRCHTLAQGKTKDAAAAAPEPVADTKAAAATLDFNAPVTVKNPYGEGNVEVVDLDFTPQPVDMDKRAGAKTALMSALSVEPPANMVRNLGRIPSQGRRLVPSCCEGAVRQPEEALPVLGPARKGRDGAHCASDRAPAQQRAVQLDQEPAESLLVLHEQHDDQAARSRPRRAPTGSRRDGVSRMA